MITRMSAEVTLCTTTDVARKYAVDDSTVRRWVAKKKIHPAITTPGGHYRFDPDEVARELADTEQVPA